MSLDPALRDALVALDQHSRDALAAGPGATSPPEVGTSTEHVRTRRAGTTLVGIGTGRTAPRPGGEPTASVPQPTSAPEGVASGACVHSADGEPVEDVTPRGPSTPDRSGAGAHSHAAVDLTEEDVTVDDGAAGGLDPRASGRLTVRGCQDSSGSHHGVLTLVHDRTGGRRPSGFPVTGAPRAPSAGWGGGAPVDGNMVLGDELTGTEPHHLQVGGDLDRQLSRGDLAPAGAPAGIGGRAGEAGR